MSIGSFLKWSIALLVVLVVGGQFAVFGALGLKKSYDYCFGSKSAQAGKELKLQYDAHYGSGTAQALLGANTDLEAARQALEAAQTDAQGMETSKLAAETAQRRRDYSQRQVIAPFEGVSSDGKLKRKFQAGEVVRYYPLEQTLRLTGDTKLYVCVGVEPYTAGNFFWIPEEILGEERLEAQAPTWMPAPCSDANVIRRSACTLAPGQESPIIQVVFDGDQAYQVDYNKSSGLLWSVNGSQWEEIPAKLPHISGVGRLKFKASPYAKSLCPVKVSLLAQRTK